MWECVCLVEVRRNVRGEGKEERKDRGNAGNANEPEMDWGNRKQRKKNKRKGVYGLGVGELELDFGYL